MERSRSIRAVSANVGTSLRVGNIADIRGVLSGFSPALSVLETSVASLSTSLATASATLAGVPNHTSRVTSLQTANTSIDSAWATLSTTMFGAPEAFAEDSVTTQLGTLSDTVQGHAVDLSNARDVAWGPALSLSGLHSDLASDMTAFSVVMATVSTAVSSPSSAVASVSNTTSGLASDVAFTSTTTVGALTTAVTTLETRNTAISTLMTEQADVTTGTQALVTTPNLYERFGQRWLESLEAVTVWDSLYDPEATASATAEGALRRMGTYARFLSTRSTRYYQSDYVYVSGVFQSSSLPILNANDATTFTTLTRSVSGPRDAFVAKYHRSGAVSWVAQVSEVNGGSESMAVDSLGNVFMALDFVSTPLKVYHADGTLFQTVPIRDGSDATACIVKYNASGTAQWVATLGIWGYYGVHVDLDGNAYVTTTTKTYAAYNVDGTEYTSGTIFADTATAGMFLVKYNSEGVVQWTTRATSDGHNAWGDRLAVDDDGNLYLLGFFSYDPRSDASRSTVIETPSGATFQTLTSPDFKAYSFVVRYSASTGEPQAVAKIDGVEAESLSVDEAGSIYVGTVARDAQLVVYEPDGTVSNSWERLYSAVDGILVKYEASLASVAWVVRMQQMYLKAISARGGAVYATGLFRGTDPSFNNADGSGFLAFGEEYDGDSFLVKYSASTGAGQWYAWLQHTTDGGRGNSVTVDKLGNVYVGGSAPGTSMTVYNADASTFATLTPLAGSYDIYFVKYDSSGTGQWATTLAGSAYDHWTQVAVPLRY